MAAPPRLRRSCQPGGESSRSARVHEACAAATVNFSAGFQNSVSNGSAVLALFHPLGMVVSQYAPPILSLGFLAKLWLSGELYGRQQAVFVGWFIIALAIQFTSQSPWMWIAGFVGQLALAIALLLKKQIDDIW
jgi:hypothetical protein